MIDVGYDAFDDPYCYRATGILRNKAGLRDAEALEAFELEMSTLRAEEPLPDGRFGPAHYRAVHRYLFQDVYSWAGRYRRPYVQGRQSVLLSRAYTGANGCSVRAA